MDGVLPPSAAAELEGVFGRRVSFDERARLEASRDYAWFSPILREALEDVAADAVVWPECVEELEELLRSASRWRVPVIVRGGGPGHAHVARRVGPMLLEAGVTRAQLEQMTVRNPARILAF